MILHAWFAEFLFCMRKTSPATSTTFKWFLVALLCLMTVQPAQAALVCSTTTPASGSFNGVVNDYWSGSGSPAAGATSIALGSRRAGGAGNSINTGDLVLLVQMQDADINSGNSNAYGSGGASGAGSTAVNSSGLYEYVVATNSVGAGGGALTFSPTLTNSYRTRAYGSSGQSTWQAIRIPSYFNATATNVTTPIWDGTTGGVVALDVTNALTLSGTTAINVAGLGFRGGAGRSLAGGAGANTDYVTSATNNANASKAEGIAGRARYLNNATGYNTAPVLQDTGAEGYPNGSYARGAPGNAGGGGTDGHTVANDENSGGGGGGNYGAGGRGGNSWNSNLTVGGIGGAAYGGTLAFNRIFLGGGGGAGTSNNATADASTYTAPPGLSCSSGALCSSGAAGGGIVIVRAGSVSGGGLIDARGADAYNVLNDGAGGGGSGGSVVLQTYSGGSASVNASGGNGGNAWRSNATGPHGPGGGGGGGFIAYSPSTGLSLAASYAGGLSGLTTTANSAFGATSSAGGLTAFDTPNVPGAQGGAFCPPAIKAVRLFTDGGTAGQVDPGDTVEYTVIYRNGSSNSIPGFNITDTLPPGLNYVASSLAITALGGASGSANASYNGSSTTSLLSSTTTLTSGGIIQATFRALVPSSPSSLLCGNKLNQANSVQSGGEVIGLTDNADNSQNSSGLPSATYISQTPFGTAGAADQTGFNVVCPTLTVGKAFSPATVNMNGNSTLTITLNNFTGSAMTGAAFTDTYPAGILNSTTPALTNSCGGTPTATAGANSISLSGGTLPANSSCVLTVSVTGTATATNTLPIGAVTVGGGASNTVAASASLTVNQAPAVSKSFSPASIAPAGNSTLTITLSNPNAFAATGAAYTDTYPSNLVNAATPAVSTTCGGTATATAGGNTVALSGGTIPAGGSCTVTVSVTSNIAGGYTNTIPVGGLTTTNIGPSVVAATGTLTVMLPPTVDKSFSPASVAATGAGNSSTMTVTLTNPNAVALTGVAFTDTYPSTNLKNNGTVASSTCGGTPTATNGGSSLALTGGTIPANGSCAITILVYASSNGNYINTIGVGGVTTAQGVSNAVAASATFSVSRLGITKTFTPASIGTGNSATLTLVLSNPTGTNRTLVGVVDNYPSGVVNTASPSASSVCSSGTNGTVTATAGGTSLTLTGATLSSGGGTCTVTVNVTSTTAGSYTNTTNAVTVNGSAASPGGATASDVLTVLNPPAVAKAFSPNSISAGSTSTLTITLSNSNASSNLTGVALTDTYPANLANAATPSASTTCGGAATATAGGGTVALSGGSIPAGASCTVTVNVTSSTGGSYTNTLAAGSVSSANASSNTSGASGGITVTAPSLVFLKSVAVYSDPANGTTTPKNIPGAEVDYTLLVTNTGNGAVDNNSITIVDPIPANTELFVGNLSGGLPFVFVNNSSGLSCVSGCMDVSIDGGTSWIPVPGGPYAPLVTHLRFKPLGSMNGGASPSFSLQFRVQVK